MVEYLVHNLLLQAKTFEQRAHIVSVGVVAWNIAILSSENRIKAINDFLDSLKFEKDFPDRQYNVSIIQECISRKSPTFDCVKLFVLDFVLKDAGNAINLQVSCDSNVAENCK